MVNNLLFKGTRLCLPNTSLRQQIARKLYSGDAADFRCNKTMVIVEDRFYWPSHIRMLLKQYHNVEFVN